MVDYIDTATIIKYTKISMITNVNKEANSLKYFQKFQVLLTR